MSENLEDFIESLQMRISALEDRIEELEWSNESWGRLVIKIASKLGREKPQPLPAEFEEELYTAEERMKEYASRYENSTPESSEASSVSSKRRGSPLENIGP